MTTERIDIVIREDGSRVVRRNLEEIGGAAGRTDREVNILQRTMRGMGGLIAGLGIGYGIAQLVKYADTWASVTGRLSLVTNSTRQLVMAQKELFDIAQNTRVGLAETVNLYAKITTSTQTLNKTDAERLKVTESINKSTIISGASAAAASAALLQLGQGFAANRLGGEELNSVLEQTPRLAQAIAEGMGKNVGDLKGLAEQGKLTAKVVFDALQSQGVKLEEEFARMPKTIAQGITQVSNAMLQAVGVFDQTNGLSRGFADSLTAVANNIGLVAAAVGGLVVTGALSWFTGMTKAIYAKVTATAASIAADRAAAAASLATTTAAATQTAATLALANARVAELRAAVLAADGNVGLAITLNGLIPAQTRAAAAAAAHTAALTAQAAAGARAAGVAGFGARALGLLGGPIGLVTTLLGIGAAAWMAWGNKAETAETNVAQTLSEKTDEVVNSLNKQIAKYEERNRLMNFAPTVAKDSSEGGEQLQAIMKKMDDVSKDKSLNSAWKTHELAKLGSEYNRVSVLMEKFGKVKEINDRNMNGDKVTQWIAKNQQYLSDAERLAATIAEAKRDLGDAYSPKIEKMITDKFAKKADDKAGKDAATQRKEAMDYIATLQQERQELGLTEQQVAMLAAARAAAAAPADQRMAIMQNALALTVEREEYKHLMEAKASSAALEAQTLKQNEMEIAAGRDRVANMQLELEQYGMGAAAITRMTIAKQQLALTNLEDTGEADVGEVAKMKALIALNEKLLGLQSQREHLDEFFATDKVEGFGDALRNAFGGADTALSKLADTMEKYQDREVKANKDKAKAMMKYSGDELMTAKAVGKINADLEKERIKSFGDMAGAAKGFFKEHTAGYKVLEGVEKAYRTYEMAMALKSFVTKSSFLTALFGIDTATKVAATTTDTAYTAASVVNSGIRATASGVAAIAFSLASLPFPFNLAAGAITAAALVAAGVAVFGGGGGAGANMQLSKDRQASQGTGTVLGDTSAKSESIANALGKLEDNSHMGLTVSENMLAMLRSINSGISGMAAMVARTSGISGTAADEKLLGIGTVKGALGFNKTQVELQDQGIMFSAGQTVGNVLANGIMASKFSEVTTTKSSWWGLSKSSSTNTSTGSLDADLAKQMSLSIADMLKTVTVAADSLGVSTVGLEAKLKDVQLGLDKVSFKGLTGAEIEKQLQAIFGSFGDKLAAIAGPGLDAFQKVGEGYMETLIRVASDTDVARFELERFGINMVELGAIANKQGDVGAELVRESILRAQTANGVLSGVGEIMRTLSGSASELAETYGNLRDAQAALVMAGLGAETMGRSLVRGAGDLDSLQSSLEKYFEIYLTDAEQVAAKTGAMGQKFAALGQIMPTTLEGFRALVESIPRTTEEGKLLLGQVLGLAEGFADLHDGTSEAKRELDRLNDRRELEVRILELTGQKAKALAISRNAELEAMDASLRGLKKQIYALEDLESAKDDLQTAYDKETNTLTTLRDKFKELGKTIRAFLDNMLLGEQSNLSPEDKYKEARSQFDKTYALAKAGDPAAMGRMTAVATELLSKSKDYNASGAGYTADFEYVRKALENTAGYADTQVDIADQQLDQLKNMVRGILDVNKSVQTVAQALTAYLAARNAAAAVGAPVGGAGGLGGPLGGPVGEAGVPQAFRDSFNNDVKAYSDKYGSDAYYQFPGQSLYEGKKVASDMIAKQLGYTGDKAWEWTGHTEAYWLDIQKQLDAGGHPTARKHGGYTPPGMVWTGEDGPELINLRSPAMVYNAQQSSAMSQGGGGVDAAALAKAIADLKNALVVELQAANIQRGVGITEQIAKLETLATKVEDQSRELARS